MHGLCDTVGTSFYFRVIGQIDGSLWGTDVYTGDSLIGAAAVHAGLMKPLEVAVLKVTVVTPPAAVHGLGAPWRHQPRFRPLWLGLPSVDDLRPPSPCETAQKIRF